MQYSTLTFKKVKHLEIVKRAYLRTKCICITYRRDFEPGIQRLINDLKQGCENSLCKLCEDAGIPIVKDLCSLSIK